MPDDIPAILAVADSLGSPSGLTDLQQSEALQAIELLRAISLRFLDSAEKIIQEGTASTELGTVATQGARVNINLFRICKALWALEDCQRMQGSAWQEAVKGKEGTDHAAN
jgi:hypothetical protein